MAAEAQRHEAERLINGINGSNTNHYQKQPVRSRRKQLPHRPGISPALGLRAGSDDVSILSQTDAELETDNMSLAACRRTLKTLARSHAPRKNASLGAPALRVGSASSQRRLLLERLEDRLALSGFGPEDGAYIVESWAGYYNDVKIQPGDQKIVAAGEFIARYDSAGSPDASYGSGGLATPPQGAQVTGGLVLQPDGKAVVASSVSGNLGAARFNTNGSVDSGFGSGGLTSVPVTSYFQHSFRLQLTYSVT